MTYKPGSLITILFAWFSVTCNTQVSATLKTSHPMLPAGKPPSVSVCSPLRTTLKPTIHHSINHRISCHTESPGIVSVDSIASLVRDINQFFAHNTDQIPETECIQQVVREVATENTNYSKFCRPYLQLVELEESNLDDLDLGKQSHAIRLKSALQACADALAHLTTRSPPQSSQLDLEQALKLKEQGKLAFHITPIEYVDFILTAGLDPRLGGYQGLAEVYRNIPDIDLRDLKLRYKEFRIPSGGFTHFTTSPGDAAERADIYNFAASTAHILAVRLNDNINNSSQDLGMSPTDYKTNAWVGAEDIALIPKKRWSEFGIVDPYEARLARISAASQKIKPGPTIQLIDPAVIKFSQDTVSGARAITESMNQSSWLDSAGPIDIVKMADGSLITADNTRLLAASRAGVRARVIVRDHGELLSQKMVKRFSTPKNLPPQTWGEAIKLRINAGKKLYRTSYPNGTYIVGSKE